METNVLFFILVGFVAQMIDGALGMAYGVISTSLLLTLGISPAAASASVHTAKVFTTAVAGLSHLGFGNVDKNLLKKLAIPGVVGGVIGALLLTSIPEDIIRPIVSVYLGIMGIIIIWKVLGKKVIKPVNTPLTPLGLAGGFFDAIGGGGWGPIVTTTLVANGTNPRYAIGSVNLAEFFVTLIQSIAFFLTIGITHGQIILGLIIGGSLAAPLSAFITRRVPAAQLMNLVGFVIIALSLRTIVMSLR
jgi:uncharacterized membrane protein YfcA